MPSAGEFQPIPGTLVIGVGHRARHGKDTAVGLLRSTFDGVKRFSFADDLYALCRDYFGMQEKDAVLLQRVGFDMRQIRPDVWVSRVYKKILASRPRVAVISDVRFRNEAAFVRQLGGVLWKCERRLPDGSLFVDPSRPADHPSEVDLDDFDWDQVLVNHEGRLDEYRDTVLCAYHALVGSLDSVAA